MLTLEQIVALLEKAFPGVRKDAIRSLAGVVAIQAEDEEAAQGIIDQMTAEKVQKFAQTYRSNIDREIQQSNQTLETNLRNKYNFVEKQTQQQQQQQQQQQFSGPLTLEQLKSLFSEQLAPLTQRMDAYDQQRTAQTRKETYLGKLKEAKISEAMVDMMSAQFDRMTFKDDAEFNAFLEASQPSIDKLAQQEANERLRADHVPGFNTVDSNGVSKAVADYLKQGKDESLGGKAV